MTDLATIDTHAVLTEPTTLRIQRLLPGPAERVWGYLVKSDLRRKWLASGEMPQQVGGKVELVWRNDELTTPSGKRPDGFPEEHRMEVQVTEIHHTEKKDSPSGTAITLAEGILEKITRKKGWVNHISDNLDQLEIISERVDPAPGTHSINYHSDIDTITITHTAHKRRGFATGAVLAAEFIAGKKGVYQMSDVLGF